jgi:hypothetical protein
MIQRPTLVANQLLRLRVIRIEIAGQSNYFIQLPRRA